MTILHRHPLLPLLLFAVASTSCIAAFSFSDLDPSTPLNQVPMIMSHDTATGYLGGNHLYELQSNPDDLLIGWTKTQIGSVTDQIECGARSFDMRPYLSAEQGLIAHHGGVIVPYPFKDMMQEMVVWANDHPDEFLLAEIYHCGGETDELKGQCDLESQKVLEELGIPFIAKNECLGGVMQDMTLGDAMAKGRVQNGGSVLAISGHCFVSNYDPSINCRGYEYETAGVSRKYSCWINGTNPSWPVRNMFDYLNTTINAGPPTNGSLWQWQALWQANQDSIVLGGAEGSSLLVDIRYSRLNRFLFENLTTSLWKGKPLNLVEVDFVCDQGLNIFQALDSNNKSISYRDIPDDITINHTGISQSILEGNDVLLPSIPDSFTPIRFTDSAAIRRRHSLTRFGHTKNIVEVFNGNEDKQRDYLVGIFATSIILLLIFALWAVVLLVCKWTGKLGWLAGQPPRPPPESKQLEHEANDDHSEQGEDHCEEEDGDDNINDVNSDSSDNGLDQADPNTPELVKFNRKVRRIRITTLISGLLVIAFSVALIADGFKDLHDALDTSAKSLDLARVLVREAQRVCHGYLDQVNDTNAARANLINLLVNSCDITNVTVDNVGTIDLIELNETLSNSTEVYDVVKKINSSLDSLVGDLQSVEDTVDDAATNILFPIAIAFIVLVDVVVAVFMVGVVLAWRRQQPRLFYDCTTKVAIPLFLVLLLISYVVSMFALIAATLAADFCVDTPDTKILEIVNAPAPFDEELSYIVGGCKPDMKPELFPDIFKAGEWFLLRIFDLLEELVALPPEEIPCPNPDLVLGAIALVQEEFEVYVEGVYNLLEALRCDRLNTVYALLVYGTSCVSGFNSLSKIFIYLFLIAICSMTIVTLRVAWYDIEDVQDEADKETHDQVAGIEEARNQSEDAEKEQFDMKKDEAIHNDEKPKDTADEEVGINGESPGENGRAARSSYESTEES